MALHGYSPEVAKLSRRGYPMAPGRGTAVARSILNGTVEEIPDILSDRDYTHGEIAKDLNYRSIVVTELGFAKTCRTLCNEVKYWLDVDRRARDDAQHLRCRDQLFKRLVTLMGASSAPEPTFTAQSG